MNNINFLHDQHVHTSYSEDSNASMEEYIKNIDLLIKKVLAFYLPKKNLLMVKLEF